MPSWPHRRTGGSLPASVHARISLAAAPRSRARCGSSPHPTTRRPSCSSTSVPSAPARVARTDAGSSRILAVGEPCAAEVELQGHRLEHAPAPARRASQGRGGRGRCAAPGRSRSRRRSRRGRRARSPRPRGRRARNGPRPASRLPATSAAAAARISGQRLGDHVRPPVRSDEHGVGLERPDGLAEPVGQPLREVGVGDTGPPAAAAYSAGWSVSPITPSRKPFASSTAGAPRPSRSRPRRPRRSRPRRGARRCRGAPRPEVERVVVRERDAVDAEQRERLDRGRRRTEEERLARVGPAAPPRRDAALEVQHEQVGLVRTARPPRARTAPTGGEVSARATLRPSIVSPASATFTLPRRVTPRFSPCRPASACRRASCAEPEPPRARTTGDDDPHGRS